MGTAQDGGGARDAAWFDAVYRSNYQAVLRYARRRVPSSDADDVVAEVFTTVWRRRDTVGDVDLPWLLRTASNHVMHAYRGADRRARLLDRIDALDRGSSLPEGESMPESDGALEAAMTHIPSSDAELLRLVAWEQLCPAELAAVLGCSATAAPVRLHRARRRLAAALAR